MIFLDTNYLIGALMAGSSEATHLLVWLKKGETVATPAICWYEFLSGPVNNEQIRTMKNIVRGGILPFTEADAEKAAFLFNATNRARRLRVDSMIAAMAIGHKVRLATNSQDDFAAFVPLGLKLLSA